jgi:hypothetical protein
MTGSAKLSVTGNSRGRAVMEPRMLFRVPGSLVNIAHFPKLNRADSTAIGPHVLLLPITGAATGCRAAAC